MHSCQSFHTLFQCGSAHSRAHPEFIDGFKGYFHLDTSANANKQWIAKLMANSLLGELVVHFWFGQIPGWKIAFSFYCANHNCGRWICTGMLSQLFKYGFSKKDEYFSPGGKLGTGLFLLRTLHQRPKGNPELEQGRKIGRSFVFIFWQMGEGSNWKNIFFQCRLFSPRYCHKICHRSEEYFFEWAGTGFFARHPDFP